MRKKLDLTGRRFGKLTVLHPGESIGACTAWLGRYDCGQEPVARADNLKNGYTKFCSFQRCKRSEEAVEARRDAERTRVRAGRDLRDNFLCALAVTRAPDNSG